MLNLGSPEYEIRLLPTLYRSNVWPVNLDTSKYTKNIINLLDLYSWVIERIVIAQLLNKFPAIIEEEGLQPCSQEPPLNHILSQM